MKREKIKTYIMNGLAYLILTTLSIVAVFPIIWMIMTSLKPSMLTFVVPPPLVFEPTLKNYADALFLRGLDRALLNSTIISLFNVALTLLVSMPAAYAFARLRIRGSKSILIDILSLRIVPPIVTAIPFFLMFSLLKLLDTQIVLILTYLTFNLPFAIWLLTSFIKETPPAYEEAGLIDGCSRLGVIARILVPIIAPGIVAVAIFSFISSWNEFLFAFMLVSFKAKTVPLVATGIQTQRAIMWGPMTAIGTLAIIPELIFFLMLRRYLVRGMSYGLVKR